MTPAVESMVAVTHVRDIDTSRTFTGCSAFTSKALERPAPDAGSSRFSLLREAAALVAARGGTAATCQVGDLGGNPCRKKADVKLADPAGDTAWACLAHADEILVAVPRAFIASQDDQGIAAFLSRRG